MRADEDGQVWGRYSTRPVRKSLGGPSVGHAAHALVRDLNEYTRFVVMPLAGRANNHGAGTCWRGRQAIPSPSAWPKAYPRYGPGEFTADDLLNRGEADAAFVVREIPHGRSRS